ncbi:MAG: hypothetical protein CME65_00045 [Halobacteriovoraceae bacterium]|nr:hypothetical protein [Halobacteriovoraceae bacterium]|tara:strand:+ start:418 stop:1920 length:1503 start_codon:yes stop_codon:yes gene_type:complete
MTTKKKETELDRIVTEVFIGVSLIFLFLSKVIWKGIRQTSAKQLFYATFGILTIGVVSFHYQWHYLLLHNLMPDIFDYDVIENLHRNYHAQTKLSFLGVLYGIYFILNGIAPTLRFYKYQKALDACTLKNSKDQKPRVVAIYNEGEYFKVIKVWAYGIGASQFKAKESLLESTFLQQIEEIRECKNRSYLEIVLSNKDLPKVIQFEEIEENLKDNSTCIVGESKKGLITTKLSDLPHMMIAGTTGGGKSKCFKGLLYSMLRTTPTLQMYLIDLKGGIEFKDFDTLSNVKVVKTIDDSVTLLKQLKTEMRKRFDYLEKKGLEKLKNSDPYDQIILGIDEASVLYAKVGREHPDYENILKARELTEEIAKLSRAAKISLILATQKVTKETIDTRIQENITGRICFKLNTIEGSVRVLGNGKASELPYIPGRGIWQCGNEQVEIQVPYISQIDLRSKLNLLKENMTDKGYKLKRSMLGSEAKKDSTKTKLFRKSLKSNPEVQL